MLSTQKQQVDRKGCSPMKNGQGEKKKLWNTGGGQEMAAMVAG